MIQHHTLGTIGEEHRGNGEALVRAIDEQVELMILNAAISASTGQHNNNGGSLQVNARISTSSFTLGALTVNLSPSAGTGWRLIEATPRPGHTVEELQKRSNKLLADLKKEL